MENPNLDLLRSMDKLNEKIDSMNRRIDLVEEVAKNILIEIGELKLSVKELSNNGGLVNEFADAETSHRKNIR